MDTTLTLSSAAEAPAQRAAAAPRYDEGNITAFTIASMCWAIAGFAVGLLLALQLAFPAFNLEPWLNFGRLRPLHTSAVIFAFGGNILFATSYHVVQRTCHTKLY